MHTLDAAAWIPRRCNAACFCEMGACCCAAREPVDDVPMRNLARLMESVSSLYADVHFFSLITASGEVL